MTAKASTEKAREGTEIESYGDYEIERKILKVSVKKNVVTLFFAQNEGATLSYLSSARNFPAELSYSVQQKKSVYLKRGKEIIEEYTGDFVCDNTVSDAEADAFESVIVEDGINYRFFAPKKKAKTLIVWFHGVKFSLCKA